MKTRLKVIAICHLLSALCVSMFAQGTAFTYQGRLDSDGSPANGTYDLRFVVYDSTNVPGTVIAGPLPKFAVPVSNGLFTVTLNFGDVFPGAERWLEVSVRTNTGIGGTYAILDLRQQLTPAPYAIMANNASNLLGTPPATQLHGPVGSANLSGSYSNAVTFASQSNSFTGDGSAVTALNASRLTSGTVPDARLSGNVALLNANQMFTGQNIFSNSVYGGGVTLVNGGNDAGAFYLRDTNGEHGSLGLAHFPGDYSASASPGDVVLRCNTSYGYSILDTGLNVGTANGCIGITLASDVYAVVTTWAISTGYAGGLGLSYGNKYIMP